jgi:uncharacterized membrane protein YphA (DoxX/SURF4 family)
VTAPDATRRRVITTVLWAAQILLAAFFLFGAALPKLVGSHSMVQEFGLIGAGQWFRYFVGTLELAGAIGLLTPWLAGLAAAGLAADMAGATIINATVLHNTTYGPNVWLTAILCALFVILAYARRQQIKDLAAAIPRRRNAGRRIALPAALSCRSTWSSDRFPDCSLSAKSGYQQQRGADGPGC